MGCCYQKKFGSRKAVFECSVPCHFLLTLALHVGHINSRSSFCDSVKYFNTLFGGNSSLLPSLSLT